MHTFDSPPASPPSPVQRFLRRNMPVLLFLVIATAGMLGTYFIFSPATTSAEALAMVQRNREYSAPISKPVETRPVEQRFAQSPAPFNLAIIVGHRGHDSGAVCDDGLTEVEVNSGIANRVQAQLAQRGYRVVLFDEFDLRLNGYDALGLVSIHADSCVDYGPELTGFKVASSSFSESSLLLDCMNQEYAAATGLGIHSTTITNHMTDYHVFRKIAPGTPAVIVETGFMFMDRELLTQRPEVPATGIANGILCYLEGIGR